MEKIIKSVKIWASEHLAGLFIFNLAIAVLVLLNSAGYFKPFFFLGINFIYFLALILAVLFLGAREKTMFLFAVLFLALAAFFKLAKVDVWADRASIYFFQAFLVGIFLLINRR